MNDAKNHGLGVGDDALELHRLTITYEVDGEVIRVVEKEVDVKYVWFLKGNSSWREW